MSCLEAGDRGQLGGDGGQGLVNPAHSRLWLNLFSTSIGRLVADSMYVVNSENITKMFNNVNPTLPGQGKF